MVGRGGCVFVLQTLLHSIGNQHTLLSTIITVTYHEVYPQEKDHPVVLRKDLS